MIDSADASGLDVPGFVYFVQAEHSDRRKKPSKEAALIKIGWTTNPEIRVREIQKCCPLNLLILATIPGTKSLERQLHERFAAMRRHGEWFMATAELLGMIKEVLPSRPDLQPGNQFHQCAGRSRRPLWEVGKDNDALMRHLADAASALE